MPSVPRVFSLKGVVQPYSWGGYHFIPRLLGAENGEGQPQAEYWLGAHPKAPSLAGAEGLPLDAVIGKDPEGFLGKVPARSFGRLPYLLKILDVRQMLSIQVHPDKASAEKGFAEENSKGVPVSAPHRNYRDDNHKPELMVALGDFWLLHGFRPEAELKKGLAAVAELKDLLPRLEAEGYRGLYRYVMEAPQEEVNRILQPLVQRILPQYQAGDLEKGDPHFWAARAVETFCPRGDYDRGIFSIYFFNLLHLKKGEGLYQAAGLPHAYLEGQNVEIMANSDNVLRAGLTDKHIDVPELIRHTRFEATVPSIITPGEGPDAVYLTPAREFALERFSLEAGAERSFTARSADILMVLEGGLMLYSGDATLGLQRGGSAFVSAGTAIRLVAGGPAVVFRAFTPVGQEEHSP